MRVCYFGIYSTAPVYPRNNNLIAGLRSVGVEVDECRVSLYESFEARARVADSPRAMLGFGWRLLASFVRLTRLFFEIPRPDVFVVGHPGYFHLHLLRLLRLFRHRQVPIVYDVYIPLYDALVCDRKMLRQGSLTARALHAFERSVCRAADLCLIDTEEHCRYLAREFGVPGDRLARIFVGSNRRLFPRAKSSPPTGEFLVLQFGTFIPLHGLDTIVRAAKLLEDDSDVRILIVGKGQLEEEIRALVRELDVKNVEIRGFVPVETLHELIAGAHVSLGIFGTTEKTTRVIPSKAFDTTAVGRPLITADTPAMREAFTHGRDVWFVPLADPESLAAGLRILRDDPDLREAIAEGGARLYEGLFADEPLGRAFVDVIRRVIRGPRGDDPVGRVRPRPPA
jgi:glycosyltransferase involved in cell wall biosynthesis